ncbi:MAG: DNA replication/repair protein RecF [Bacillota bacterium]
MAAIESLELRHFRTYEALTTSFNPHINIILGNNAQGKTSLLEAIHTLALTKSHKTASDRELIAHDASFTAIKAKLRGTQGTQTLELVISKDGKKARHNNVDYKRLSDYIGFLNVVMFAPEDLNLIKGGPAERRRFFNLEIGQLNRHYVYHLNQYRRLLKERNDQLKIMQKKHIQDDPLLDVLSEQMHHYIERITRERKRFIDTLDTTVRSIYESLSNEKTPVALRYLPSITGDVKDAFDRKRRFDIQSGNTSIGPHRDDCGFYFGENPVMHTASQGQIRTLALSLKLAVVQMIKDSRHVAPIVLLDDVFSELDDSRQKNLLSFFDGDSQIFITSTSLDAMHMNALKSYKVFKVEAGQIEGVKSYGSII